MLSNGLDHTAYYLICATFGLVILGMAANQWRILKTDEYQRMAIAGVVISIGSLVMLLLLRFSEPRSRACLDWLFLALTLATFIWAFLFKPIPRRPWFIAFAGFVAVSVVTPTALCLFTGPVTLAAFPALAPGAAAPLMISGFGALYWLLNRRQNSVWLGFVFLISPLGAGAGLLGLRDFALLAYLAILPLLAIETYATVIDDLGAYGGELQEMGDAALRQTQNMAFLLEVSHTIAASLELSVILERVTESVARAVDADWAYFMLPSPDNQDHVILAAQYGWWGRHSKQDQRIQRQERIDLDDFSLLKHAITRRRQVLANRSEDYQQFERLHGRLTRPQRGPTLIQPIYQQSHFLGVILLGLSGSERTFDQSDGKLCGALVAPVANAIDNARLYQDVDAQAQHLARVLRAREKEATERQAILDSIADGVIVADQDGEITLANKTAATILGLTREQLMEQSIGPLYTNLLNSTAQQKGDSTTFQWGEKMLMGSLAPVKMADGSSSGSVVVFRDVTKDRQVEQARSELIASVSRELRVPMNTVQGSAELLYAGAAGRVSPKQRHFLEVLRSNAERMNRLVNNLVALSEVEHGTLEIDARSVDMRQLVNEAVDAIRPQADEGQLDLGVSIPRDLAPAWGDPQCLRQVVDNLLDNALRNTPPQGQVTIWATETSLDNEEGSPESFLVISIRDSGPGIDPEDQDKIFDRFYRADSSLPGPAGGTGPGLAVVRSLVAAHGGLVWVDSEPGEGSTFCFTVPSAEMA